MSQAAVGVFNEELVRALSESLKEPDWLLGLRLEALRYFLSLPPEKNPLYTKYVTTFNLDVSKYGLVPGNPQVDFRAFFGDYLRGSENNILLQGNETLLHADLDEETAAKGVRLSSLHSALYEDETYVKGLFETRVVKPADDKMSAFATAFFNGGAIVRVPVGAVLAAPLRRMLVLDSPKNSIVDLTFVLAEEGARAVFLEELLSKGVPHQGLVASTTEVRTGPDAHLDISSIQLLDDQTAHSSNRAIEIGNDAHATFSSLSLGGATSRSRTNFLLNGRGSVAEGFEIFFTDGKQLYDFETNLLHNSPDSTGSTQARGVLKGQSQSIFKGMIKIVKGARNSRSYLAHHAMLLERTAKSDGVPSLEIDNNEVKATHSASVAQLDEEQLFYLGARGLPLDEARKVIVLGFFEPVLSRIPIEQTREGARFMIEGKWLGEKRKLIDREVQSASEGQVQEVKQSEDIFERHYKYR